MTLSALASGAWKFTVSVDSPPGTLILKAFSWPKPRPTELVIRSWTAPRPAGIRVRRATGNEVSVVWPLVNCTDSGWSPGAAGNVTVSGTVALECALMVTGLLAGEVAQSCPDTLNDRFPVKAPGAGCATARSWSTPPHKILAVHFPGCGSDTSTCWLFGIVPARVAVGSVPSS